MSSTVVYGREIDGETLVLSASGWTYVYTFVLYDYNTESMWYPVHIGDPGDQGGCGCALLGIAGEFGGRMLQALPSESMSWLLWFGAHPDTKILKDPDVGTGNLGSKHIIGAER